MNPTGEFRAFCKRRGYARATIAKRLQFARGWLEHMGDEWTTATWRDVEDWVTDPEWELSPSAQRDAVSHLRQFYWWAVREDLCASDPTQHVLIPRQTQRLPRPASEGDVTLMLLTAPPAMAAMIALMAGAGLRCCEVATLRWSDVTLGERLWIRGKGGHERVVPMSSDVTRRLAAIDGVDRRANVFTGPRGRPYAPGRVSQLVSQHARECGSHVTAHMFRHRYATVALGECGDITIVARLLGHRSAATTEIYARVSDRTTTATGLAIRLPDTDQTVLF